MRSWRSLALLSLCLPLALGAAEQPDVADLSLLWTRGEFKAPLVCTIDGTPRRGLRRLLVTPGPRDAREPTNRLRFFDLEVPRGTTCSSALGGAEPNVIGNLYFALDAISRPDLAAREFETRLRREGGIEFAIRRGRLRVGDPAQDPASLPVVDFAGGSARFAKVGRGSDASRRLADFGALRKLTLELRAPDGTRLELDLVQTDHR